MTTAQHSSQILQKTPLYGLDEYHGERPIGPREDARVWRHAGMEGVELFRGYYKNYQFARHFHTMPAIGIVAHGAMTSYCRGATHTLPTGTVFLINPEEVHAPGPAIADDWVLRVFYIEDSVYQRLSSKFVPGSFRFSQVFVEDQILTDNLLALHRGLEQSSSALEIDSTFVEAFSRLAERYTVIPERMPYATKENARVAIVKEYLEAQHAKNVTLQDLADVAQISPYHLLRTFRTTTGLTPHDYLTQIRIEEAKRLLRIGRSLSDIALDTGFTDQSHFTRNFKRIMGVTPGQYYPHRLRRSTTL